MAVPVVRRQVRLVGADRADLQREHRIRQAAEHQLAHRRQGVGTALERDEVLELVEVGVVEHRIDPVAAVGAAAGGVVVGLVVARLVVDLHVALVGHRLTVAVEVVQRGGLIGGQPEEAEVAMPVDELVPSLEHLLPGPQVDLLAEAVGAGHLELYLGHHPEHPDRHLRGAQQLGLALGDLAHLARSGDEPDAAHDAREAGVADAGPVRRRGHGAGDLLGVDVALVLEREALGPQRLVEPVDRRARQRSRPLALAIGSDDAAQRREVEQQAVGRDHRCERMPGAGDSDPSAQIDRVADERGHLLLVARGRAVPGRERLIADPVGPCLGGGEVGQHQCGY